VTIDLGAIGEYELRLAEVSTVNPHKAPELRAALGLAWSKTREIVAACTKEKRVADNLAKRLRGRIVFDSPQTSPDRRRAEADIDPQVVAALDRHAHIEAVLVWLEDKAASFKAGYFDVARAAGEAPSPPVAPLHARPMTVFEPRQVPHPRAPDPDASPQPPYRRASREPELK